MAAESPPCAGAAESAGRGPSWRVVPASSESSDEDEESGGGRPSDAASDATTVQLLAIPEGEERPSAERWGAPRPGYTAMLLADVCGSLAAHPSLPVLFGHLYKRTPNRLRMMRYDWRFFVVRNCRLMWWRDREACVPNWMLRGRQLSSTIVEAAVESTTFPRKRGMLDLAASPAQLLADEGETGFELRPVGSWAVGATTDKDQDTSRVYRFDATGSEHSRAQWVNALARHIDGARMRQASMKSAVSEAWQDDSIDQEQAEYCMKLRAARANAAGS